MFDVDNDGVITQAEMKDVVAGIYNMLNINNNIPVEEFAANIFKKIVTKDDGAITEEAFTNVCLRDNELYDLIAPNGTKS